MSTRVKLKWQKYTGILIKDFLNNYSNAYLFKGIFVTHTSGCIQYTTEKWNSAAHSDFIEKLEVNVLKPFNLKVDISSHAFSKTAYFQIRQAFPENDYRKVLPFPYKQATTLLLLKGLPDENIQTNDYLKFKIHDKKALLL